MNAQIDDGTKPTPEDAFEFFMRRKYANGKFLCQGCGHTNCYKIKRSRMKCQECGQSELKRKQKNYSFACKRCGSLDGYEVPMPTLLECKECGKQTTITAGTAFHGAKISIDTIAAIVLDMGQGVVKSAAKVAGEVGVAISTAHRNMHKCRLVMYKFFAPDEEVEEIHHSSFRERLWRRTTESPASYDETLSEYEARTTEIPTGNLSQAALVLILKLCEFLESGFQGVSRKLLQLYVAQSNYVMRYADQPHLLMDLCFRTRWIRDKDVRCYSSPEMIRIVQPKGYQRQQPAPLVCETVPVTQWGFVASSAVQFCLT